MHGDVHWVNGPGDIENGGPVWIRLSATGEILLYIYTQLTIHLVRSAYPIDGLREPGEGIVTDQSHLVLVLSDELMIALTLALDQAGALWETDNFGLDRLTADVQVSRLGPDADAAPPLDTEIPASWLLATPITANLGLQASFLMVKKTFRSRNRVFFRGGLTIIIMVLTETLECLSSRHLWLVHKTWATTEWVNRNVPVTGAPPASCTVQQLCCSKHAEAGDVCVQ